MTPLPCPFCGSQHVAVIEGDTFRWRLARCGNCGAQAGDVRIQTMGEGTKEAWERQAEQHAIAEWNRRAAQSAPDRDSVVEECIRIGEGVAAKYNNNKIPPPELTCGAYAVVEALRALKSAPAKLADEAKDAARLQWLIAKNAKMIECCVERKGYLSTAPDAKWERWDEFSGWTVSTLPPDVKNEYPTMREAIDAAIAADKGATTAPPSTVSLDPAISEIVARRLPDMLESTAPPSREAEHVCGLQGYNRMIDPPCPACEANGDRQDGEYAPIVPRRAPPSREAELQAVWDQAKRNHATYSATSDVEQDIRFLTLGLTGEAGEVANFVKKRWRDGDEHTDAIQKEIADVCAYAFMLADTVGMTPASLLATIALKQRTFIEKMEAARRLATPTEGKDNG